ncbi:protein kinase domain-containing protein [Actinacidiphila oryziradicis]|nr:protein kinase [Actinacidiphila oryziradicis]
MPDHNRSRLGAMAYAAAGVEPPPTIPPREDDPERVGPYLIVSVLGSGRTGRIYLGRGATGARDLAAVKVLRSEYAEDPRFRKRFEREIDALARVQSAHTAQLMGSGCDEALVWVATEYTPGPTLAEAVTARGPINAAAAWRLMADLGRAIEAMWRAGIVHRDLKPSNVILAADGARVIDFGVVQAAGSSAVTATGQHLGTPAYMSPEQAVGQQVTAASDVFSLASTLTYALVGKAPFGEDPGADVLHRVASEPPREEVLDKVAAIDPDLAVFIRACLDKDPERRPAPGQVFRTAIGHQLSAPAGSPPRPARSSSSARDKPPAAPPAATDPPAATAAPAASAPRKRRNVWAAAVAGVAVLAAGGAAVALLQPGGDQASAQHGPRSSPAATGIRTEAPGTSPSATEPTPTATASKAAVPPAAVKPAATQDSSSLDIRSGSCPAQITSEAGGKNCVTALQTLLVGYGLNLAVDGQFGAETLAAVKVFQTEAGVAADGKVGAQTKKYLYSQPPGPVRVGALTVTESVHATDVGRCLDAGSGPANGQSVRVWQCTAARNQKWALYHVPGQSSRYTIVNQGDHRCLDADIGTVGKNGQPIRGRNCDGLSAQRWTLGTPDPSRGGTLVSVPDGFCLDAYAPASGQNGQKVQGWGCAGSSNQVWHWA